LSKDSDTDFVEVTGVPKTSLEAIDSCVLAEDLANKYLKNSNQWG
jgi:hypothetical protein